MNELANEEEKESNEEESEEEDDEIKRPAPGPLQKPPDPAYIPQVLGLYLCFLFVSILYWKFSWGERLAVSADGVFVHKEYWRLLTALFVHADFAHFISNGPLFLIFGWYLRAYCGPFAFPVLPLALGILTNLFCICFYEPQTRLVGASGMLYAMVALWTVFYVAWDNRYSVGMRIFRASGFALVLLFPSTFQPEVSYLAHSIGFGLGLASAFLLQPLLKARSEEGRSPELPVQ